MVTSSISWENGHVMNFFKAEEDDEEAAGRSAPVGRRLLASTRLLDD